MVEQMILEQMISFYGNLIEKIHGVLGFRVLIGQRNGLIWA